MKLSAELIKSENEYVARCPELDINCYGSNKDEAIRRLKSVIQFYIDSAKELGLEIEGLVAISIDGKVARHTSNNTNLQCSNSVN